MGKGHRNAEAQGWEGTGSFSLGGKFDPDTGGLRPGGRGPALEWTEAGLGVGVGVDGM